MLYFTCKSNDQCLNEVSVSPPISLSFLSDVVYTGGKDPDLKHDVIIATLRQKSEKQQHLQQTRCINSNS